MSINLVNNQKVILNQKIPNTNILSDEQRTKLSKSVDKVNAELNSITNYTPDMNKIYDVFEVSSAGKVVSDTLGKYDEKNLENMFKYSKNIISDFSKDYQVRRSRIIKATSLDKELSSKKNELLSELDKKANKIIEKFSDTYLNKIDEVVELSKKLDKELVAENIVKGYKGNPNIHITEEEKSLVKSDYKKMFTNAIDYVKSNNTIAGLTSDIVEKGTKMRIKDANAMESKFNNLIGEMAVNHLHKKMQNWIKEINPEGKQSKAYIDVSKELKDTSDNSILADRYSDLLKNIFSKFIYSSVLNFE